MSENLERDTHFANFAKLLWDELVNLNEYGYIDVNDWDDGTDPTNYRKLIAQRAYDLAAYTLNMCRALELDLDWIDAVDPANKIPDLTQWLFTATVPEPPE